MGLEHFKYNTILLDLFLEQELLLHLRLQVTVQLVYLQVLPMTFMLEKFAQLVTLVHGPVLFF